MKPAMSATDRTNSPSTSGLVHALVEAALVAKTRATNPAAMSRNWTGAKETRPISWAWRIVRAPSTRAMTRKGTSTRKIERHPSAPMRKPPSEGPTAGAMAVMSVARPIMVPIRSWGTCCSTMLNISGSATPVPTPCRMRPPIRSEKCGAAALMIVPARKVIMAARKSVRARNLRFRNEEIGMIAESTSRYPVVTHCTVAVFTPNSPMSAGKATFIAVSTTTPANDMMPTATMETTRRASRHRSNPDTLLVLISHPGHDGSANPAGPILAP